MTTNHNSKNNIPNQNRPLYKNPLMKKFQITYCTILLFWITSCASTQKIAKLPGTYHGNELMLSKTLILKDDFSCIFKMEGDLYYYPEETKGIWKTIGNKIIIRTNGDNPRFKRKYVFKIQTTGLTRGQNLYNKEN